MVNGLEEFIPWMWCHVARFGDVELTWSYTVSLRNGLDIYNNESLESTINPPYLTPRKTEKKPNSTLYLWTFQEPLIGFGIRARGGGLLDEFDVWFDVDNASTTVVNNSQ